MRCKHERAPEHATFCPDCGARLVKDRGSVKVPPPSVLPSGTFFGRVTVKGERISVSASTEEEYYAKARAAKLGLIETKKTAPKVTLGAAIDKYIEANDTVLSPSTVNAYKSYRKTRFTKYMDSGIDQINFQKMVNEESKIVSPKTVHNAWRLVTAVLNSAGVDVPEINLPKKPRSERPWLDYKQIEVFLGAIRGKPYELGALLALNGLRRSELLHLTADDVDTENGLIYVRGASVVGAGNKLVDKDTNKNASSTRTVHVVIPRINELVKSKNGRLITTNPTTLYGLINGLCKKSGLPEVGVHGLRHSFASLAYHLQWSEATTMREGGWANTDTVHKVYIHLAAQDANADIKRMQDFFQGAGKNGNKNANESAHA